MDNLVYIDLKLQNYLKDVKITAQDAQNLYRFRTRAARFKDNMKNSYNVSSTCPLCHVQPDTQVHSVKCPVVQSKVKVKGCYSDIFLEDIPTDIAKTLLDITQLRDDII